MQLALLKSAPQVRSHPVHVYIFEVTILITLNFLLGRSEYSTSTPNVNPKKKLDMITPGWTISADDDDDDSDDSVDLETNSVQEKRYANAISGISTGQTKMSNNGSLAGARSFQLNTGKSSDGFKLEEKQEEKRDVNTDFASNINICTSFVFIFLNYLVIFNIF
jgi:hypothetical protein